jgi:hypothetical protein
MDIERYSCGLIRGVIQAVKDTYQIRVTEGGSLYVYRILTPY